MKKDRNNKGQFLKGFAHPPKKKNIDLILLRKEYLKGKSTIKLGKLFGVSDRTIANRLREIGILRTRKEAMQYCKKRIRETLIKKGIKPSVRYSGKVWNKGLTIEDKRVKKNIQGLLKNRKYQVLPKKDSSIEIKIQNFLNKLNIKFIKHKWMDIKEGYQCDIFIPKQKNIDNNIIIECFGDYWHKYPRSREIDIRRCEQLRKKGYKVLVLWENEIKKMVLKDIKGIVYSNRYL